MTSHTGTDAPAATSSAAWRRSTLFCDGHAVAVFECGRSDAGAPAILFVHGIGHWTQAAWDLLAAELQNTHRIVAFDLPGFGDSAKPNVRYALEFFTAALRAVVAHARLQRFTLVGHSLGGMVAANYAALHAGDVRLLALLAPAGFSRTPKLALRIVMSGPAQLLFRRARPTRGIVRRTFVAAVHDPASVPEEYFERAYALSQDAGVARAFVGVYAAARREFFGMKALHRRFAAYRGKTLIVWGRQDRFVPIAALPAVKRVYPQAYVLEIERCGHCPSIEYPQVLAARLIAAGA